MLHYGVQLTNYMSPWFYYSHTEGVRLWYVSKPLTVSQYERIWEKLTLSDLFQNANYRSLVYLNPVPLSSWAWLSCLLSEQSSVYLQWVPLLFDFVSFLESCVCQSLKLYLCHLVRFPDIDRFRSKTILIKNLAVCLCVIECSWACAW